MSRTFCWALVVIGIALLVLMIYLLSHGKSGCGWLCVLLTILTLGVGVGLLMP